MAITREQFFTIQPGDLVLLEKNCRGKKYGVSQMKKWEGTVVEVVRTSYDSDDCWIQIQEDKGCWGWFLDMIADIMPAGEIEPPAPLSDLFGGDTA